MCELLFFDSQLLKSLSWTQCSSSPRIRWIQSVSYSTNMQCHRNIQTLSCKWKCFQPLCSEKLQPTPATSGSGKRWHSALHSSSLVNNVTKLLSFIPGCSNYCHWKHVLSAPVRFRAELVILHKFAVVYRHIQALACERKMLLTTSRRELQPTPAVVHELELMYHPRVSYECMVHTCSGSSEIWTADWYPKSHLWSSKEI